MITEKSKAIEEVSKSKVDFDLIDKKLLQDKDVVRAYIQRHSSNIILVSKNPIDINYSGMIDNESFITDIIRNLNVGYDKSSLEALLKFSASSIIRKKLDNNTLIGEERLRSDAKRLLMRYNVQVKKKVAELSEKQRMLEGLDLEILNTSMPALEDEISGRQSKISNERYRRSDIGFTAKF